MVLPVFWPVPTFFHPIGNTSAVDLTDTLTPEETAHVLLLGCGDPRNILFTIHSQRHESSRILEFTCCDVEPAILARNVLLLTMIADNRSPADAMDKIWNTFFHFFLDEQSTAFLEAQCQKLLHESTSLDAWNRSEHSSFLRFCNEHTRLELRRHWQLYIDAGRASVQKKREIKEGILSEMQKVRSRYDGIVYSGYRSTGPYVVEAETGTASKVFRHFWTTGTTFMNKEVPPLAAYVNPTFVYSLAGTIFSVHHETTPIAPFHLAPAFLRSKPASTTASDLVDCAKSQFRDWVASFQKFLKRQLGRITIRLFCGEALRFCHALAEYRVTGSVSEDQTIAPWNTSPLVFDGPDYTGNTSTPLTFNVIETSNLADHVGLLNVLIATVQLLSETHSATLFTEILLYVANDPTKIINQQLCTDLPTISILLNLLPTSYPSNFSSRSNVTETILYGMLGAQIPQYHERLVWRRPTTGDTLASALNAPSNHRIAFESDGLAGLLFKVYYHMFSYGDMFSRLTEVESNAQLPVISYVRETFVALVATIKRIAIVDWEVTLDLFFGILVDIKSTAILIGLYYHNDLCTQLHLAGIYTAYAMTKDVIKQGRFQRWRRVPPTVSITLVVPRECLEVLLDMDRAELSTPMLQASLQGRSTHSSFSSIRVGFGKVENSGTDSDPRITFDADPAGWAGSSPLIVSFSLPSRLLQDPDDLTIALSLRKTPQTVHLIPKLCPHLNVFTAQLADTSVVFVVPEEPHGMCHRLCNTPLQACDSDGPKISAVMDTEGGRVSTLTARADILDNLTRTILSSGAPVTSRQVSPCAIEISIGPEKRRLVYPSPVVGTLSKLRIARKSYYIEVVAPLAGKCGININPFPVSVTEKVEAPWNIHRLNLDILPTVDISAQEQPIYASMQFRCAVTDRELSLRDAKVHTDTLLNIKGSIQTIFSEFQGSRRARVFALRGGKVANTVIFVTALRLDLASHGFVIDAQVLTLSHHMFQELGDINPDTGVVELHGEEAVAWKQLLPAFAERCRTWEHGRNCEYLVRKRVPLSLEYTGDPLCSCGKGKDVAPELRKKKAWSSVIPHVTRIAIGPLYGVPYAESAVRVAAELMGMELPGSGKRCQKCGGLGIPKLLVCGRCKGASYCSVDCQKADWKSHKGTCHK